eukprot:g3771.t1
MQEEVDVKTRKLKKLFAKVQEARTEIEDVKSANQREREELLDTMRELTRQLKLKQLIIEHFVPADDTSRLEARAEWDDARDDWRMAPPAGLRLDAWPAVVPGERRPESDYARHRKRYDANPRFKVENVAAFELDTVERTTQDYSASAMQQRVQEALTAALEGDEEDLQMDAPENLPSAVPLPVHLVWAEVPISDVAQLVREHYDKVKRSGYLEADMAAELEANKAERKCVTSLPVGAKPGPTATTGQSEAQGG